MNLISPGSSEIRSVIKSLLPYGPYDALAVGIINFQNKTFEALEANFFQSEVKFTTDPTLYFDLASLTKPLTNSLSYFLEPEAFDQNLLLCLNHRAGLPAWGLLSKEHWKEQILSYPITESETLYSDFSALRVLLELEKKGIKEKALCEKVWDRETLFWKDLPLWYPTIQYGYKQGRPNFGQVHDPNAFNINAFSSHAGLFSTIDGLCRTLLSYQEQTNFIDKVKVDLTKHSHRFSFGWDRVENPEQGLAGKGCGKYTFGHLGFTGTSIWIDPDRGLGHIILSNATKYHWYDKQGLNEIRRAIGEIVWK
jgi:hypothetical protein